MKSMLQGKLGFGTAPLGNMFRNIPEDEAMATVDAAWEHGIRYFDTAPFMVPVWLRSALVKHCQNTGATTM